MKGRLIKVLQVARKFGFIMAAVMMFPYISSFPAVMANDGENTIEAHEVSMDDLEQEYAVVQNQQDKEMYLVENLQEFLILNEDGMLELALPSNFSNVSDEDIQYVQENIELINDMVENDEAYVTHEFDVFVRDFDEGFFTMFRIYAFKITWTGVYMKLDGQATMAFGIAAIVFHLESFLGDVSNLLKLTNKNAMATMFATAMFVMPAHLLSHTVVALIENNIALIVGALLSLNLALMTTGGFGTVAKTAVKYLLGQYIPSMAKAGEMVWYGMKGYHYSADIRLLKFKAYYNRV